MAMQEVSAESITKEMELWISVDTPIHVAQHRREHVAQHHPWTELWMSVETK